MNGRLMAPRRQPLKCDVSMTGCFCIDRFRILDLRICQCLSKSSTVISVLKRHHICVQRSRVASDTSIDLVDMAIT